jgi:hypothetical protein
MRTLRPALGLVVLGVCCGLTVAQSIAAGGGFILLVNHSNAASSLSRSELKRVITGGTKQWDNGAVVQIGIIPNDAPETQYLASLLDTSPRELLARVQEQVFKGELRRPAVLRSSSDCVAFARASAGAICVASDSEAVPPEAHAVVIP